MDGFPSGAFREKRGSDLFSFILVVGLWVDGWKQRGLQPGHDRLIEIDGFIALSD